MKYIITGTGRTGTRWCSETLQKFNEPIDWESIFYHDTSRQNLRYRVEQVNAAGQTAESSWMAAPWLIHPIFEATVIYHVVRHPLKQIASILKVMGPSPDRHPQNRPYHEFNIRHLPELRGMRMEEACLARYVMWNEMIEESTQLRFRLEDQMPEMFKMILQDRAPEEGNPLYEVKAHNRWLPGDPPTLTWDNLPDGHWKEQCQALAKKYGYAL